MWFGFELLIALKNYMGSSVRRSVRSFISFLTGRSSVAINMADSNAVKEMIKSDKVVIFSKSYCPYCKMAKDVFTKLKEKATVYELDERDDGSAIQEILGEITGAKSVPRVFVHGQFIGGGTDVEKMMKSGTLQPLLAG